MTDYELREATRAEDWRRVVVLQRRAGLDYREALIRARLAEGLVSRQAIAHAAALNYEPVDGFNVKAVEPLDRSGLVRRLAYLLEIKGTALWACDVADEAVRQYGVESDYPRRAVEEIREWAHGGPRVSCSLLGTARVGARRGATEGGRAVWSAVAAGAQEARASAIDPRRSTRAAGAMLRAAQYLGDEPLVRLGCVRLLLGEL